MTYLSTARPIRQQFLRLYHPAGIPAWLETYIATPAMQHLAKIDQTCGIVYSDLVHITSGSCNSLEHSVAMALIVWHFTKNRAETLAGLFHDIATPAFKHCVDVMDGDYMTEESTEALTTEIIKNSPEITTLLAQDGISIAAVSDYHLYPIADNDTPRLAADRLEYSLTNMLIYGLADFTEVQRFYQDLTVLENESGLPELGFRHHALARRFVELTSRLSVIYRGDAMRFSNQLIADILHGLIEDGLLTRADLWQLGDAEVIQIIERSRYADIFDTWRHATTVHTSPHPPADLYHVHHGAKIRWIDPLVTGKDLDGDGFLDLTTYRASGHPAPRISTLSSAAKSAITANHAHPMDCYVYLDFALPG